MHCCAGTTVTFNIQNNYNTYRFGGHKVMLAEVSDAPILKLFVAEVGLCGRY